MITATARACMRRVRDVQRTSAILSRTFGNHGGESLSEGRFHEVANDTLERVAIAMEDLEDRLGDDFDVVESDGVLTIQLGSGFGTYVLNKQTPNRQIWWSSPISGPKRYEFDEKSHRWVNTRDGHLLSDILQTEIRDSLDVTLPDVDGDESA
eukprot:g2416.t1